MARQAPEESSPLTWPLLMVTKSALRWPRATLGLALTLALLAALYATAELELHTSRLDLLNPDSSYNKLWLDFIDEFGEEDDVVVVVEGESREAVVPVVEEVYAELERHKGHFHEVLHKVDLARLYPKSLHYLSPEDLAELERCIDLLAPVMQGDWSGLNLALLMGRLAALAGSQRPEAGNGNNGLSALPDGGALGGHASAASAGDTLALHLDNLTGALQGREHFVSPWSNLDPLNEAAEQFTTHYSMTYGDRIAIVLLRLEDDGSSFARGNAAIDQLRAALAKVQARHGEVKIGLTGLPIMENDEMRASQTATLQASLLSLVGVSLLFIAGFGGVRHPLMAVAALVLALSWSCGYLTLVVGHLNILSMSFGMILIGLGIDYGVHYLARYLQLRETIETSQAALLQTAKCVGPGIVTGGTTTAIAFFAAGLTDFTGIVELGIIAGGGILLCVAAAVVVLPTVIYLSDRNRSGSTLPRPLSISGGLAIHSRLPATTVVLSIVVTALFATGLQKLWYDHNLLNLQPVGLESVKLEQHLLDKTDQSVWYAISVADSPEDLAARKRRFERLDSVQRTEEIVSLLPGRDAQRSAAIQRIGNCLASLPERPPLIEVSSPDALAQHLAALEAQAARLEGADRLAERAERAAGALAGAAPGDVYRAVSRYQQQIADDLLYRLRQLAGMCDPVEPSMDDLPESLVQRFVGRSGRHLLKVYSKADIWDMDALADFVEQVRHVDPMATGKPLQTYEASRQMLRSYMHAALYALIVICMLLVLDFQSIYYSLLALLPVGLGLLQLFGLLGLLGVPLNPANLIVLPLILGIGLDDGVHVVHDFRIQTGRYRLSRSTATAILLTSLTTMVGFGSMMIADHRGLQSLGRVLTIGVSCCLFTSLVPLPALLTWLTRHRPDEEPDSPDSDNPPEAEENALAGALPDRVPAA